MNTSAMSKLLPVMILLLVTVIFAGCGGKTQETIMTPASETASEPKPTTGGEGNMRVTSTAFQDNGPIPEKYARQGAGGDNVSIPLWWTDAPEGAKSFAFAMVDTSARNWVHWLVINIPVKTTSIIEGASGKSMPEGSKELTNTFGEIGYGGPQPPPSSGVHDYVTTIYALNVAGLDLPQQISYDDFLQALDGKVLAKASITGTFSR